MKLCRCGELLATPVQLRMGWCSVKCQQAHTPIPRHHADHIVHVGNMVTPKPVDVRRMPPANIRDDRG